MYNSTHQHKYSQFNNLLQPSEEITLLYNSLSGSLIRLSSNSLPKNLEELPDVIKTSLMNLGFIVDSNTSEWEEAFDKMVKHLSSDDNFYLIVNPTLNCNCRCWYCIETHPIHSHMSLETLDKIKEFILTILPKVNSITISFFGGEPFLEFDKIIKPLMEWANDVCKNQNKKLYFIFTTNSLLLDENKIEFLKDFSNQSYQITLDGGRESHNSTRVLKGGDSYGKIINTIKSLSSHGLPVIVRLNLTHNNLESAFDIPEDFKSFSDDEKKYLSVTCQQVWQDVANGDLHDSFINVKKAFHKIGIRSEISTLNWITNSCYADRLNCAIINYNGDIFKCSAIDYCKEPPITSIDAPDIFDDLKSNFNDFIIEKRSLSDCRSCRIAPLCMRGCYKKNLINRHGCLYPTNSDKDQLILRLLEELTLTSTPSSTTSSK